MFWPSALWAIGAILPMSGGRHGRQDLREDTSGPGVSPSRCRKGCACYVPDHLYNDNLVVFLCWIIICFVHMKMVKARCGSWSLKKCIYCFIICHVCPLCLGLVVLQRKAYTNHSIDVFLDNVDLSFRIKHVHVKSSIYNNVQEKVRLIPTSKMGKKSIGCSCRHRSQIQDGPGETHWNSQVASGVKILQCLV